MELKKNPKADLEKRRGLYLEIGLVVTMVAALVAFNVKRYDKAEKVQFERHASEEQEEIIIQTQQDELPPPPPPEQPEVTTQFEEVEDDAEIENELSVNAEVTDDTKNTEIVPVSIEEEVEEEDQTIFTVVENEPEFPGGYDALMKYLGENIKYPQLARDNNIVGKVYITFVVERDGSIADARVVKDIGGGCGQEALRVVKSMPKWKPGKQQGRSVRVQYNLPVSFRLR